MNRYVDDTLAAEGLKVAMADRSILLVAPGRSVVTERKRIGQYIDENRPLVIGVNAMVSDYTYDYVFYVNEARYAYAFSSSRERFEAPHRIVLSNIKTEADKGECVIAFEHAAKRGWPHYDNAVICCLRMLDWLGIEEVAIAGFDGFKNIYNDSYADPTLPTLKTDGKWDELNDEIRDMFQEFKANATACKRITMLTESYFA